VSVARADGLSSSGDEQVVATKPRGQVVRVPSPAGAARLGGARRRHVAWRRGALRVRCPDADAFVLLTGLAHTFGGAVVGAVVGEAGEVYDEAGRVAG
jgi:hypothetical protein